ncbi:hypothetical protein D3C85_1879000 [compost metagenome]
MSVHQTWGAGVTRQFNTLGLLACEPSLQTGHMPAPDAWNGIAPVTPDVFDAGSMYRQSHERRPYP